jgi:predicted phosphodiesterase
MQQSQGMRLAILSDVHANPIALDAVLRDVEERGGADGYWVLGNCVAMGFDPTAVLQRLTTLPNVRFVRGNTDRYVLAGQGATARGPLTIADAQVNPDLIPTLVFITQGLAWTYGFLAATGWIDWLGNLPLEQRLTLPDGTRLLGVHAAPGVDDGPGVEPWTTDDERRDMLVGCAADLVLVGHTHQPLDRMVGHIRVVNVGSVSLPDADRRASYALLAADRDGFHLRLHRVAYDTAAVIRAVYAQHVLPYPAWFVDKFADP